MEEISNSSRKVFVAVNGFSILEKQYGLAVVASARSFFLLSQSHFFHYYVSYLVLYQCGSTVAVLYSYSTSYITEFIAVHFYVRLMQAIVAINETDSTTNELHVVQLRARLAVTVLQSS